MKKVCFIFYKDLRIMLKDFITLYIILCPLLFALIINIVAPSVNDTTVNLGLINGTDPSAIDYLSQFAHVEVFENRELLNLRIKERDDFFGLIKINENYTIIAEGNESGRSEDYARLLAAFDVANISFEDTSVKFESFNLTISPTKRLLVNGGLMFISVLGGMLILISIVEEKSDKTINAINLTTLSREKFIIGKSIIGVLYPAIGAILLLYLTDFSHISVPAMLLIILSLSLHSAFIGMIIGLSSDDIMTAGGNMKILFLPLMLSVAGAEMLNSFWQKFLYWSPFYWAYKAINLVLEGNINWQHLLYYTSVIIIISLLIIAILIPKIRKRLK